MSTSTTTTRYVHTMSTGSVFLTIKMFTSPAPSSSVLCSTSFNSISRPHLMRTHSILAELTNLYFLYGLELQLRLSENLPISLPIILSMSEWWATLARGSPMVRRHTHIRTVSSLVSNVVCFARAALQNTAFLFCLLHSWWSVSLLVSVLL